MTENSHIEIGWDIGIKNLSYCVLQKLSEKEYKTWVKDKKCVLDINGTKIGVVSWDIINLQNNINNDLVNDGVLPITGKSISSCVVKDCGKKSNYGVSINKTLIRKMKKDSEGNKMYMKYGQNYYIGYCKSHKTLAIESHPNTTLYSIEKKKKATGINLTVLGAELYNELDKRNDIVVKNVNVSLLENQPVLKNPNMKSMQMLLYSYYILRGMVDVKKGSDGSDGSDGSAEGNGDADGGNSNKSIPLKKIMCYQANNKLKITKYLPKNIVDEIEENTKSNPKTKKGYTGYQKNKKRAISYTKYLINEVAHGDDKFKKFFNDSKKQDDLADSFLMVLYHLLES